MTLLSDRPEEATGTGAAPSSPSVTETPGAARRRGGSRWPTTVAFIVVVVVVLYAFFGAFVSQLWFQVRQRSLAGEGISLVAPSNGQALGELQATSPFTLNVVLVQGDDAGDLRAAPGHEPGTPLPGERGNSVVYGHADQWGGPFGVLSQATTGTPLYLKTAGGAYLAYDVIGVHRVSGSGLARYLGPSNDYRLTLVTDAGSRFSDERLVVVAVSGNKGHEGLYAGRIRIGPERAPVVGLTLLELVGWLAAATAVWLLLRRSQRRLVLLSATMPLLLGGIVALYVELTTFWSPLS
jgi:sortase (surface protein transpeptidase)